MSGVQGCNGAGLGTFAGLLQFVTEPGWETGRGSEPILAGSDLKMNQACLFGQSRIVKVSPGRNSIAIARLKIGSELEFSRAGAAS